jgi:hypothetical protein
MHSYQTCIIGLPLVLLHVNLLCSLCVLMLGQMISRLWIYNRLCKPID